MRKVDHRNEETKIKLAQAFKKLSLKKGVSKVSVADITGYCHLNRNTFYYHFEDIRSLLNWMFEQDCTKVISSLKDGNVKSLIVSCINYTQDNRKLLKDTYESLGNEPLSRAFAPYFERTIGSIVEKYEAQENIKLNNNYKKFLIRFFCEAVGGMMFANVRKQADFSQDELIDNITDALNSIPLFVSKKRGGLIGKCTLQLKENNQ